MWCLWTHNFYVFGKRARDKTEEFVAFANRGSSSFGFFEVGDELDTLEVINITDITSEPMYVSSSNPNCEKDQSSNILIGMHTQYLFFSIQIGFLILYFFFYYYLLVTDLLDSGILFLIL